MVVTVHICRVWHCSTLLTVLGGAAQHSIGNMGEYCTGSIQQQQQHPAAAAVAAATSSSSSSISSIIRLHVSLTLFALELEECRQDAWQEC